jgi:hypothetical protein
MRLSRVAPKPAAAFDAAWQTGKQSGGNKNGVNLIGDAE